MLSKLKRILSENTTDSTELEQFGYKKSGKEKKIHGGLDYQHGGLEQKYVHPQKSDHYISKQIFKSGPIYLTSRNTKHPKFKQEPIAAFSTVKSAIQFNESNVIQMPGTHKWNVGDRVTHPDHEGVHVIYSIPTIRDGRHPKTVAVIHPEHNKNVSHFKKIKLRDLKLHNG